MKKSLLSLFLISGVAFASTAQVTIDVDGGNTDIAGTTEQYNIAPPTQDLHMIDFLITNNTGGSTDMYVTRRIISQPNDWEEYMCWGLDGQLGLCYAPSPNEYFTSTAVNFADGEVGRLATYINSTNNGVAVYRFYVSYDGQNYVDSVDFQVNGTASTPEIAPELSVGVNPNPASDNFTVTAGGVSSANVQIVDVLGNVVLNTTISGSKTFDVAEYRNGIYFVTVSSKGTRVSRKVIVRH
ncbi:MAG: hypothetical protein DCO96_02955 [Fluviicola sp. XM-24bin1]|nr:MAG: hypothetical protein DCO96_02955 [Fluviicola sp. XM-24bin1]